MRKITMLGSGLIGMFYTLTLHERRSKDQVQVVYSRTEDHAREFAEQYDVPDWTTDLDEAIQHPDTDVVVIGLPNHLHLEAVQKAAQAGKAVLCTKPLGRTAEEGKKMLDIVEEAGVFHGYLEDLVYTPKSLKAKTGHRRRGHRPRDRGPLPRNPSRSALGLVLGPRKSRRRGHDRHGLPLPGNLP